MHIAWKITNRLTHTHTHVGILSKPTLRTQVPLSEFFRCEMEKLFCAKASLCKNSCWKHLCVKRLFLEKTLVCAKASVCKASVFKSVCVKLLCVIASRCKSYCLNFSDAKWKSCSVQRRLCVKTLVGNAFV